VMRASGALRSPPFRAGAMSCLIGLVSLRSEPAPENLSHPTRGPDTSMPMFRRRVRDGGQREQVMAILGEQVLELRLVRTGESGLFAERLCGRGVVFRSDVAVEHGEARLVACADRGAV